jgi:hypothetical protein
MQVTVNNGTHAFQVGAQLVNHALDKVVDEDKRAQNRERSSANQCGTCTLCCKLVSVDETKKPVGQWCPHCSLGKGCQIYDTRPAECRTWDCLWLQGAFGNEPDLRPDKCKVVVGYQAGFIVVVEDASPPKSGLRFVEELKKMGKPMVIKRFGHPGIKLANTTTKEAVAAGVIA